MSRSLSPSHALALVSLACWLGVALAPEAEDFQAKSLPLFDGESLAGWEGNAYWFRIEGDAIVAGRLDEKIPHNEFLCTTQNYDDFELRLEAKLVGEGQNAGIQFRSKRVPGSTEVSGYQADAGAAWDRPVWGALYDESRRRKMLAEPDPDLAKRLVKTDQWNEIRVICRGPKIQIFLNGAGAARKPCVPVFLQYGQYGRCHRCTALSVCVVCTTTAA